MPWICIRPGESLSKVARARGYAPQKVWDLPENAEFRQRVPSKDHPAPWTLAYFGPRQPLVVSGLRTGQRHTIVIDNAWKVLCPYCDGIRESSSGEQTCHFAPDEVIGNNRGSGTRLRTRIWGTDGHLDHPWWVGPGALQAHHLICSEVLRPDYWRDICHDFGYDIDRGENGVMLPYSMALACFLAVPLHRGCHAKTTPQYPVVVEKELEVVQTKLEDGVFCTADGPARFRGEMDSISRRIMDAVAQFEWKITFDGDDYHPDKARGCAGCRSLPAKRRMSSESVCLDGFSHERASVVEAETRLHPREAFTQIQTGVEVEGFQAAGRKAPLPLQANDAHLKQD